jgi:hypothetical protein
VIVRSCGTRPSGDDSVVRSVEVETASSDTTTITVTVPHEFSPADQAEVNGPLGLALLMAMRAGEDLHLDGLVDPGLYARLGEIREIYRAYDRTLHPAAVTVRGLLERHRAPSPLTGVYLSRGVDSMYAAARARSAVGALDCAIFIDALVPGNGRAVRAEELRLVGEASKLLGLPLIVVEAPLRRWTDGVFDWADASGAGLAWVGHELSGGLGRVVIPSSDSVNVLASTCGSSPALDPLFSSGSMTIEHGFVSRTRLGKVQWLAEHRPDLLPLLKVCLTDDRADNCGRCIKCLHTMVCLRAAGVLAQASQFPPDLDLDTIASLRLPLLNLRYEFHVAQAAAAEAGDRPLAEALDGALTATVRSGTVAPRGPIDSFRAANSNMYLTLMGRAWMNDLQGEVEDLRRRLERADGVIHDLQDSVSWRVTTPLRRAKQAARRWVRR